MAAGKKPLMQRWHLSLKPSKSIAKGALSIESAPLKCSQGTKKFYLLLS